MKPTGAVHALLLSMSVAACGGGSGTTTPPRPQPEEVLLAQVSERDANPEVHGADLTALVAGNTAFALDMFATVAGDTPTKNVALGPYSISQAMAMLYAGARGQTAAEMKSVLHIDVEADRFHPTFNGLDLELLSRNGDVTLRIANQVWAQKGLEPQPAFLDVLTGSYGAPLAVLDFAADVEEARAAINAWVGQVTEDKIPMLFPPNSLQPNTQLVLTNAMYMDAPWKYQFDPGATSARPFTTADGTEVTVDMMHFNEFLPSAYDEEWQAVELPYKGDELSMVVVVPRDLARFEATLTPARLQEILGAIEDGGIHLAMPKFTFSFHTSLMEAFETLGAPSLFQGADFSGIAPGLVVSAIEHEAYIQVDEEGTKAAAATGVALADSHGPTVSVDRPFMFFVIDRPTRAVLFLGRVADPSAM